MVRNQQQNQEKLRFSAIISTKEFLYTVRFIWGLAGLMSWLDPRGSGFSPLPVGLYWLYQSPNQPGLSSLAAEGKKAGKGKRPLPPRGPRFSARRNEGFFILLILSIFLLQ